MSLAPDVAHTVHVYAPRGSAAEVFGRRDPEVLMSGAAGTGKSRACLEKINAAMIKYPGARALILRKTLVSLASSALKTWREDVVTEQLASGSLDYYGGSQEEPPQYRYDNGSRILVGGMDKPTKIMSTEYDLIYVQEATELTVTDWEFASTRLRNGRMPYQQLIADCNPDAPTHWLHERAAAGKLRMINCRHEDNPRLFDLLPDGTFRLTDYGRNYMARLDALTGVRYLRLRLGQWVAAEGVIYDGFDPAVHIVDAMPKGWQHWARYWSVDFGFTNPFVLQCWAEDPDGRLWLYRELYRTQRTVDEHARDILRIVSEDGTAAGRWREPRPQLIVADHDAENRERFEREIGMSTRAARKAVLNGIELVQVRLRPAGDRRPRLFILRGALVEQDPLLIESRRPTSTLEEIGGYVWAPGPDGKPLKEQPLKINDHGMDAMRYIVAERDPSGRPGIRSLG